ncbi:MAG: UDP-N-acetylmuramate--L-alanine ligase [Desulfobacterales bacterium]|jgi:UDP-N-acetylmuramate--alanine ligase|nr:UDP-N-acetylmuramate--L-alanine ligase [Desulfobacter sp.]MDP6395541.1 UDP-N-acetylmuramate--L-alanine ligase [Desulfobacterales bacterium]MDP6682197.1 UDP-N-acetylmuramate--L-alanine ligase [Desulfobacterales bacterium]MDP6807060.1 UDP-N-acetylmuramate--L-alanine ligase [Desulfobacterales bacterium]|tara:strand:- start:18528 stop:19901 length:1374 start_codon:yes stop_codon:yes gene_type:complete
MYLKKYHIHFVGIGGIGMSGIAELLLNLGYTVSGSDLKSTDIIRRLKGFGGKIFKGHMEDQIAGADVVVTSSAVSADNPEVVAAEKVSIPVIPRAEMLAELMRLKYSVAIAGAHGKTSTTSIVAAVMEKGGLDPTVVIGGKLKSIGFNARLGQGEHIVAEADESDGSFLKMSPTIAVVTNIDREHLDFYTDLDAIKDAFLSFIDRIPFYGLAVLCLDNEPLQDLIPNIKRRLTTYGMGIQADFQAKEVVLDGFKSMFSIYHFEKNLGKVVLNLPGIHNVYNALSGVVVGMELGIPFDKIRQGLETVEGVQRRLEIKGEVRGVIVVDDYGHHPTEIKLTLQTVKKIWPGRRIVVAFQPHRYTRINALFDDFARAFYQSDVLVVLPIYSAGEKSIEGIDGHGICKAIRAHGHREVVFSEGSEAVLYLQKNLKKEDILLTLGAGDVWKVGEEVLKKMKSD